MAAELPVGESRSTVPQRYWLGQVLRAGAVSRGTILCYAEHETQSRPKHRPRLHALAMTAASASDRPSRASTCQSTESGGSVGAFTASCCGRACDADADTFDSPPENGA
eukprot:6045638-Pleurochrysis_carterae.AAC.1